MCIATPGHGMSMFGFYSMNERGGREGERGESHMVMSPNRQHITVTISDLSVCTTIWVYIGRICTLWHPAFRKLPCLSLYLCSVCKSIKSWLDSDPLHVAVVHCKGGKGRTGCVIAAFMHYSEICHRYAGSMIGH